MDEIYTYNRFKSLNSTNDEAIIFANNGAPSFSVITSDHQFQGRGRNGNTWLSLYGNLYLSVILRNQKNINFLPFISAVSIGETIKSLTGLKPEYKWPNDVFIMGKKVSGILIESKHQCSLEWVIVGIGVNINGSPLSKSTYINKFSCVQKSTFEAELLKNFFKFIKISEHVGFHVIKNIWMKNSITIESQIPF